MTAYRSRSKTLSEMIEGECVDVLICQPPLTMRIAYQDQHSDVRAYFEASSSIAPLLGDNPYEPNNGVLLLAAELRSAGLSVAYLDFHLLDIDYRAQNGGDPAPDGYFLEVLSRFRYQALGITVMTISAPFSLKLAKWSKVCNQDAPVFVGGLFPSAMPSYFDSESLIVCQGSDTAITLANHFGMSPSSTESMPAYDLIPSDIELIPRISTTHGCSAKCAFCSPVHLSIKDRLPVDPVERARALANNLFDVLEAYKPKAFLIGNLSLFSTPTVDREFLKIIAQENCGVPFWCQVRPDSFRDDDLDLLAVAGCKQIAVGVESASPNALKRAAKGYRLPSLSDEDSQLVRVWIEPTLQAIKDVGISAYGYFIVGMPGETPSDIGATRRLVSNLIEDGLLDATHISIPVPYPGTPWFDRPAQFGFEIAHRKYEEYWMNSDPLGYGMPVISTPMLSREALFEEWLETLRAATAEFLRRKSVVGRFHNYVSPLGTSAVVGAARRST